MACKQIPSVVALGMFDGMHIGHRAVITRAVSAAREGGFQSVVYTFLNHPRSVFASAPVPIMDARERERTMYALGVDRVDMVAFDRELAQLPPDAFVRALCAHYDLRAVVVGSDYTFGRLGAGTVGTLRDMAGERGFSVIEVPFVTLEEEKVSSTRIRRALEEGETDLAERMLGR